MKSKTTFLYKVKYFCFASIALIPLSCYADNALLERCQSVVSEDAENAKRFTLRVFGGKVDIPLYYELIAREIRTHHFTRSDGSLGRLETGTSETVDSIISKSPDEVFQYKTLNIEVYEAEVGENIKSFLVRYGEEFMLISDSNECQWYRILKEYREHGD